MDNVRDEPSVVSIVHAISNIPFSSIVFSPLLFLCFFPLLLSSLLSSLSLSVSLSLIKALIPPPSSSLHCPSEVGLPGRRRLNACLAVRGGPGWLGRSRPASFLDTRLRTAGLDWHFFFFFSCRLRGFARLNVCLLA